MRDLFKGLRGSDVQQWQEFLIAQGLLKTKATGNFLDLTDRATRDFQRAQGIEVDGVVGKETRKRATQIAQRKEIPAQAPARRKRPPTPAPAPAPPLPAPVIPPLPPAPDGGAFVLTEPTLRQVMPGISATNCANYLPFLQAAMIEFAINTPVRAAAFLAQLAHESGQLKFMEEIWGPTAAQRRYEPPGKKARGLGNTEPGDGFRYKGRGPIQLTGRDNYRRYGAALGIDLEGHPELAATKEVGFRIAGLFWAKNGLNELADEHRFRLITRRINGGFNGLADRQKFHARAKTALGVRAIEERDDESFALPIEEDVLPFPRGLDLPGEIAPTAAERNPTDARPSAAGARRKSAGKRVPTKQAAPAKTAKRLRKNSG